MADWKQVLNDLGWSWVLRGFFIMFMFGVFIGVLIKAAVG